MARNREIELHPPSPHRPQPLQHVLSHLRCVRSLGSRLYEEVFGQVNYDQFRHLEFRGVVGSGSRANASAMVLLLTLLAAWTPGQASEWLQLRGDRQMSGQASGVGQMRHGPPQERWRYDIAAWEGYVEVAQQESDASVTLPFAAPVAPNYISTHGRFAGWAPNCRAKDEIAEFRSAWFPTSLLFPPCCSIRALGREAANLECKRRRRQGRQAFPRCHQSRRCVGKRLFRRKFGTVSVLAAGTPESIVDWRASLSPRTPAPNAAPRETLFEIPCPLSLAPKIVSNLRKARPSGKWLRQDFGGACRATVPR